MKTIILIMGLILSFETPAEGSILDLYIQNTVHACSSEKGYFHKYETISKTDLQESEDQSCVFYSCAGDINDKNLRIGNQRLPSKKSVGQVLSGHICLSKREQNYVANKFEELTYLNSYLCFDKCHINPDSKKCIDCNTKEANLKGCKISNDYKSIECPESSHLIQGSLKQSIMNLR